MRLTKSCAAIQLGRRPRQQSASPPPFLLPSPPPAESCHSFQSPSLSVKLSPRFLTDSILDLATAAAAAVVPRTRYTTRSATHARSQVATRRPQIAKGGIQKECNGNSFISMLDCFCSLTITELKLEEISKNHNSSRKIQFDDSA